MNCKRIRKLLMTDYSDGEISEVLKRKVEGHLNTCDKCAQLQQALQKTAIEPFKTAEEIEPPISVWNNIKEAVAQEETSQEGVFSFTRKPAFALATAVTVILIALVFARIPFNGTRAVRGYLEEQADFFTYLEADADIELGTTIEEYFL